MKKLFNLILLVTTSLLFLSCEKEKYPGAYPYDDIILYNEAGIYENTVTEKDSVLVIYEPSKYWDKDLYPMTLWVDNEEIATISQSGYLTGKKEGTVTVYARVMSINGEIEDSIKYSVKDYLKELIKANYYYLDFIDLIDLDRNKDENIIVSELQQTDSINQFIDSDILLLFAPYMPNLKAVRVNADTTSRILDLSNYKFKQLAIQDYCFEYALSEANTYYLDKWYFNKYKNIFLKELKLNNAIEHLTIWYLPGIKTLDLRQYTNLKTVIRRIATYHDSEWYELELILPENIENVSLFQTEINFDYACPNLKKLVYNFQGYADISKHKRIVLNKKQLPNLKIIDARQGIRNLDISTFQASEIDTAYIITDTIFISQSMYDARYSSGKTIYAEHYIIK